MSSSTTLLLIEKRGSPRVEDVCTSFLGISDKIRILSSINVLLISMVYACNLRTISLIPLISVANSSVRVLNSLKYSSSFSSKSDSMFSIWSSDSFDSGIDLTICECSLVIPSKATRRASIREITCWRVRPCVLGF